MAAVDVEYAKLVDGGGRIPAEYCYLAGKLDGMYEMIRILSVPYYESIQDVADEAEARHDAAVAKKYHRTPGCETVTAVGDKRIANTEMRVPIPGERHAKRVS